jgi:PPK2 family polyphosphate:nucleotide phosphotransferase
MSILKPKIPELFEAIVAPFAKKTKLGDFPADYSDYKAIKSYSTKEVEEIAKDMLSDGIAKLESASDILWASKQYGILIILQGMDTSGKDGTIRHVMSGINPQACRVASFKVPTALEASHDFLWRCALQLPAKGEVVVFNRSHYEAVLVTKVHPEFLEELPSQLSLENNKNFWDDRYEDINAFEKHLARNGTLVLKFFLNISQDEQKKRLLERLKNEDKYWKISPADFTERKFWKQYISVYEDMLSATSTEYAPWIIVPANDKPVARAIVADTIAHAVSQLGINFPQTSKEQIAQFQKIKKELEQKDAK